MFKEKECFYILQYSCARHFLSVSLKLGRLMTHQHIVFFFTAPPTLSLVAMCVGVNVTVFSHKEKRAS